MAIFCENSGHPLENILIVDRIAAFLGTQDLFNCRLVSQKWNRCCVKRLKTTNRYTIKLTELILPEYIEFLQTRADYMEWCNKYRVSLDLRYAESWIIGSLTDASVMLQVLGMQPLKTMWNSIRNKDRLKYWCNSAEKMVLGECIDLSLLEQENLIQDITNLEISLDSSTLPYSEILNFEFISLEALKVTVHDHLTKLDWQCLKEFIIKSCPKLKTFRLNLVDDGKMFWACMCGSCEEYDDFRNTFSDVKFTFD